MLRLRKPSPAMAVACIALFVALSGVGTAAVVVLKKNSVLSKHIKNGQVQSVDVKDSSLLALDFAPGQLPQGPKGDPGADGSPDTPAQVLAKVTQVDGAGSGLDADLMDGLNSSDLQRRGSVTSCTGNDKVTGLAANGNVTCASDNTTPSGSAGGDLTGTYPGPSIRANAVDGSKVQDGSLRQADVTLPGATLAVGFGGGTTVQARQCRVVLRLSDIPGLIAGDIVVPKVTAGDLAEGIILVPYVAAHDGELVLTVCNALSTDSSVSGTINFAFRPIR